MILVVVYSKWRHHENAVGTPSGQGGVRVHVQQPYFSFLCLVYVTGNQWLVVPLAKGFSSIGEIQNFPRPFNTGHWYKDYMKGFIQETVLCPLNRGDPT